MNNKICYVVGAGENYGFKIRPEDKDYVIAVDGGYEYLEGIRVDLVVGDFDSLGGRPEHHNVLELEPEKDDTDMMIALKEGLKAGYRLFYIYCGMGGRFSHTVANLECLVYLASQNAHGFLFGKDEAVTVLQNDTIFFREEKTGYISVFAHTDQARGVSISGLKYELNEAELSNRIPLGISNEFTGRPSQISVKDGTLLIIYSVSAALPRFQFF